MTSINSAATAVPSVEQTKLLRQSNEGDTGNKGSPVANAKEENEVNKSEGLVLKNDAPEAGESAKLLQAEARETQNNLRGNQDQLGGNLDITV